MQIFDISLPISPSLITWPGDPAIKIEKVMDYAKGDSLSLTRLDMGAHTGTHVDAPVHFIKGGVGVDALDVNTLIGPALVVENLKINAITADVLQALNIPNNTQRLLFHTHNSEHWARMDHEFNKEYVGVTADGAKWLVDHHVRLVGVDYLSVAPFTDTAPTHQILLGAGIVVVEGLNLSGIIPGDYQLICLPLKIVGSDGGPARVVLTR